MKSIYTTTHQLHNPDYEMVGSEPIPPYECPARANAVYDRLQELALGPILEPVTHGTDPIARVHHQDYIDFLEQSWSLRTEDQTSNQSLPYCFANRDEVTRVPDHFDGKLGYYSFDLSSPITAGTWDAITGSVDVALTGVDHVQSGDRVCFSVCRPPGHHAGPDQMGGYCFFNNAAIAAQAFLDDGCSKVAICDVDYHHGNGTQKIFYERNDVLFTSIHGHPNEEYPHFWGFDDETGAGDGEGFTLNKPLPLGSTTWMEYRVALEECLAKIQSFGPDRLIVSLGLDTFETDPIANFKLTTPDYLEMGKLLATMDLPTLFVFEGGYAIDRLAINTTNVLEGFLQ